jgi:hypothetical protein
MKFILIVLSLAFISSTTFASNQYGETCLTHGQCQELVPVELGHKCLIVKTGVSPRGKVTCALRCYPVVMGSYCKKFVGSQIGICKKEKYQVPRFDASKPNCDSAIDPF